MRSIAVSTVAGPALQFTPTASAPQEVSFAAAVSHEAPSRQFASSSTVTSASTGTPGAASAAASSACSASFSAEIVSMTSRSTPPATSPLICSVNAARASSSEVLPSGSSSTPSGPTDPATQASPACLSASCATACRASCAPAWLIAKTLSCIPKWAQPKGVRAEGVRLDDLRARLQILLVDRAHQLGLRQVQLVVAAVDEDAAFVEHRPHRSVEQHRALTKDFLKSSHSCRSIFHAMPQRGASAPADAGLCYTSVSGKFVRNGTVRGWFEEEKFAAPVVFHPFVTVRSGSSNGYVCSWRVAARTSTLRAAICRPAASPTGS